MWLGKQAIVQGTWYILEDIMNANMCAVMFALALAVACLFRRQEICSWGTCSVAMQGPVDKIWKLMG